MKTLRAEGFAEQAGKRPKDLAGTAVATIFALLLRETTVEATECNAALVNRLRRLPFTEESRVRVPYVVQIKAL